MTPVPLQRGDAALLNERADLSPEMALRIEKAFGLSTDTLTQMQSSFGIPDARTTDGQINIAAFTGKDTPL